MALLTPHPTLSPLRGEGNTTHCSLLISTIRDKNVLPANEHSATTTRHPENGVSPVLALAILFLFHSLLSQAAETPSRNGNSPSEVR